MPGVPTKNGEPFGSPFESGRRDLNPRPPEPHSGALPGCATSRLTKPQEQVAQTPSGSQSHASSHQNQPRTTCSLTGLRGACPEPPPRAKRGGSEGSRYQQSQDAKYKTPSGSQFQASSGKELTQGSAPR